VPQVTTLPLPLYNAAMGGNYQVASITAMILLVPSVLFMLFIERFLRADVPAKVGGLSMMTLGLVDGSFHLSLRER